MRPHTYNLLPILVMSASLRHFPGKPPLIKSFNGLFSPTIKFIFFFLSWAAGYAVGFNLFGWISIGILIPPPSQSGSQGSNGDVGERYNYNIMLGT